MNTLTESLTPELTFLLPFVALSAHCSAPGPAAPTSVGHIMYWGINAYCPHYATEFVSHL